MKTRFIAAVSILLCLLLSTSCSTAVKFYCVDEFVEIYINGEYAGRGLVHYTSPRSQKFVTVSCNYEGLEIYSRTFYVKDRNGETIDLQIPRDYFYSTDKH